MPKTRVSCVLRLTLYIIIVSRCGRRLPTQRRSFLVGNLLCRQKNIIDVRTGCIVKTLDDFVSTRRYVTCCITPDQQYILIGEEMVTKLFNFKHGTLLATFPAENLPCVFVLSEDSRHVYVGYVEDCIFKVQYVLYQLFEGFHYNMLCKHSF